jgi:hypothetical protein
MKRRITIATGALDSQGDILDLKGVKFAAAIPVTKNFRLDHYMGEAENISIEGNELKADIDIPETGQVLFPAIGFSMKEADWEIDENGNRRIKSFKIYGVGLCDSPNVDPNVPPITV